MMDHWLERAAAWLQGRTPRERAGLCLVIAAGSVSLAVASFDAASSINRHAAALREDVHRMSAVQARDEDFGYRSTLKAAADKATALSIRESTVGVAQARALSAARALAEEAGLGTVVVAPAAASSTDSVAVSLSADFSWTSLAAILGAMETSDVAFGVEQITVTTDAEGAKTMVLRLRAPFVLKRVGA